MSAKHTIVINGKTYDTITGLPLGVSHSNTKYTATTTKQPETARPARHHKAKPAKRIPQKSLTLRRSHLEAPKSQLQPSAPVRHRAGHVARSPMITRFATHPQPMQKRPTNIISDMAPIPREKPKNVTVVSDSKSIKKGLIANASKKIDTSLATKPAKIKLADKVKVRKNRHLKQGFGLKQVVTISSIVFLLGGYLTYINIPGLSVGIAGSQAGVAASYPHYRPDGYSFDGPVAYEPGEVKLRFKSNGGTDGFTIKQRASTWNSVAVLDNLVEKESAGKYQTTSEGGVTIYTYDDNKAAWTNGGILYTIDGNAPLNNEQIIRIAASM